MPPRKKRGTLAEVDAQLEKLCSLLEPRKPKEGEPAVEELSTTQRSDIVRELRQFLKLKSQLEQAQPVDEAKLAHSEPFKRVKKAWVDAVQDCPRCLEAVTKALEAL